MEFERFGYRIWCGSLDVFIFPFNKGIRVTGKGLHHSVNVREGWMALGFGELMCDLAAFILCWVTLIEYSSI